MVRARRPGKRLLKRIAGLREPLDVLTTQGTVLVERLRQVPLRGASLLARSAEQLVTAGKEINALLEEVATAAGHGVPRPSERMLEAREIPEAIALVVRGAIVEVGGSSEAVDVRVSSLPEGWIRVGLEETGMGTDDIDFVRLLDATRHALVVLGLAVAGGVVSAHAGRLLARADPLRTVTWDADSPFHARFPWTGEDAGAVEVVRREGDLDIVVRK